MKRGEISTIAFRKRQLSEAIARLRELGVPSDEITSTVRFVIGEHRDTGPNKERVWSAQPQSDPGEGGE